MLKTSIKNIFSTYRKIENYFDSKFRKIFHIDLENGERVSIILLKYLKPLLVIALLGAIGFFITSIYFKDWSEYKFIPILILLFLSFCFFLAKLIQFQEEEIEKRGNDLINTKSDERTQIKLLEKTIRENELKYENNINELKQSTQHKIETLSKEYVKLVSEGMEEYKNKTIEKVEKNILDNVFTSTSSNFNESKEISHEEYLHKKRKEKEEFVREKEKHEIEKKLFDLSQTIFGVKNEVGEKMLGQERKHMQHDKERAELKYEFNSKLSQLENMIVQGLAQLDAKIVAELSKIEQSISQLKSWTENNLTQIKYFVKEEILKLSENQMKIVNKMEQLEIRYKGDIREMQLHIQEFNHQIDKVAFDAHERSLALSYVIKEEGLRLDRKIEGDVLRLERADMANDKLLEGIKHNLEKGLLMTKMEQKESEYRQDAKYQDLKGTTEKTILEARFDNERNMFVFKESINKRLDELVYEHNISIKDLTHLAEIKNIKLENLISQKHTDISNQIVEMKAKNEIDLVKMDTKYTVQLNDMQTLNMKLHYENDQKIMKVISKIESLHNDISGMNVKMEGMKVEIQRTGLANEQIKQDAQNLLYRIETRMDSINSSLKMAQESFHLQKEQIDTKVRGDLLRLKEITIDQESNLKQIAFAEQGMKLIYDDYNNKAVEKELQAKRLYDNVDLMNKRIRDERRAMQVENRLQQGEYAMNNKVMNLQYDRDSWKKEAEDNNREANMYRKAAEHYQKKSRKKY